MRGPAQSSTPDPQLGRARTAPSQAGALAAMMAVGLAIRLVGISAPPFDFHIERQLFSALRARGMYYEWFAGSSPDWMTEFAIRTGRGLPMIEPPLMEVLAAVTYSVTGEHLWIPRAYAALFWVLGAPAVYALAARIAPRNVALVSAGLYLFLPFAIAASRGFQPDPAMTALIVVFVWALVRWNESTEPRWALTAGLIGGFAVLVKAVSVFFVLGALVGLVLAALGPRRALRQRQVWLTVALVLIPAGAYTAYGVFVNGALSSQFQARFIPSVLTDPLNYALWLSNVALAVGVLVLLALVGTAWTQERELRGMLIGWWVGYLLYTIAFDYHAATHSYYQLPLIPLVAIAMAGFIHAFPERVRTGRVPGGRRPGPAMVVIALMSLFSVHLTATASGLAVRPRAIEEKVAVWADIADALQTSHRQPPEVVGLTENQGFRAAYWGWFKVTPWPTTADLRLRAYLQGGEGNFELRFAELAEGKDFFLVTNRAELIRQPGLAEHLDRNYPKVVDVGSFLIYDLTGGGSDAPQGIRP